ncbi:4Fe-4S double cluster binding domain-containing protein [Vallitalea okinawensis]|uniref:4Fe-4S double cluster binding domain-containing protein n=1 Tax=Vallitalea okinawensis TaxID=2078660 RepID=UPI000CFC74AC|nr:epoxyqueuosine reductase [Vallitalea okinawensis]
MSLSKRLKKVLKENGADIIGFADLSPINSDEKLSFQYGISIAVALDPNVINNLCDGVTREYESEYENKNHKLDELALLAAELLREEGYEAFLQTTTEVVIKSDHRTNLPHKTVARRSGLGWIGKCALLITPEYGSAIRLTSVLTNAELETSTIDKKLSCGNCKLCEISCPGGAVKGVNWAESKQREDIYDAIKCRKEARRRSEFNGIYKSLCGVCILTCPYTKKYKEASNIVYRGNDIQPI